MLNMNIKKDQTFLVLNDPLASIGGLGSLASMGWLGSHASINKIKNKKKDYLVKIFKITVKRLKINH